MGLRKNSYSSLQSCSCCGGGCGGDLSSARGLNHNNGLVGWAFLCYCHNGIITPWDKNPAVEWTGCGLFETRRLCLDNASLNSPLSRAPLHKPRIHKTHPLGTATFMSGIVPLAKQRSLFSQSSLCVNRIGLSGCSSDKDSANKDAELIITQC